MNKALRKAYEMVLNDIANSGCGLMVGKYDAKNGNEDFINGVSTVMEWIAYKVSDEMGDDFSDTFTQNITISKQLAEGIKCFNCAEVEGCYKGQNGGKKNCRCFSPKSVDKQFKVQYTKDKLKKER